MKKVCVVTGARAEYGLLRWLMEDIQKSPKLDLQIVVTGMHLSPEFGLTYREIEKDEFHIDRKVEMLLSSDTPSAITKSIGLGMIGFADALAQLQPDVVILLGDRYELLAAATAAMVAQIAIAHIHGGETTEGAFDESIRHSITKMAWWHFVAATEYEQRVIQLGEAPQRVFNVGALGVDNIIKTKLLSKAEVTDKTGIHFRTRNLLATFHPVTLDLNSSHEQFQALLDALDGLNDVNFIFTMPNSDTDGRVIKDMISDFVSNNRDRSIAFTSMGCLNYLSTLQYVDGVIGNSSSGLIEAPSLRIGTVNIGDRQKGRLKASSVIDCDPTKGSIEQAIVKLYSESFQDHLPAVVNPYGKGGASGKILDALEQTTLPKTLKKTFHNI